MANAPPPALKALVDNVGCQGCYGIEWVHDGGIIECKSYYNPQWRIDQVKAKGLQGLYTTHSTRFNFGVGQGLVGKVFQEQRLLFVSDVQDLTQEGIASAMQGWDSLEFARADLAKDFGIFSVIFLPTETGVIEIGSSSKVPTIPTFFSDEAKDIVEGNHRPVFVVEWDVRNDKVIAAGHYAPEVPAGCSLEQGLYQKVVVPSDADAKSPVCMLFRAAKERQVVTEGGQHSLAKLFGLQASKETQAVFWPVPNSSRVIEVAFASELVGEKPEVAPMPNISCAGLSTACKLLKAPIAIEWRLVGDTVVCAGHYNSQERVDKCAKNFGGSRYTLESYDYSFKLGEGIVGRVYKSGVSELIPDLLQMPPATYKRAKLAEKFDVRTAVFLAVKGDSGAVESVLEICTDRVCQMFEADISHADALPKNVQAELSTLASPGMNSIY